MNTEKRLERVMRILHESAIRVDSGFIQNPVNLFIKRESCTCEDCESGIEFELNAGVQSGPHKLEFIVYGHSILELVGNAESEIVRLSQIATGLKKYVTKNDQLLMPAGTGLLASIV